MYSLYNSLKTLSNLTSKKFKRNSIQLAMPPNETQDDPPKLDRGFDCSTNVARCSMTHNQACWNLAYWPENSTCTIC